MIEELREEAVSMDVVCEWSSQGVAGSSSLGSRDEQQKGEVGDGQRRRLHDSERETA